MECIPLKWNSISLKRNSIPLKWISISLKWNDMDRYRISLKLNSISLKLNWIPLKSNWIPLKWNSISLKWNSISLKWNSISLKWNAIPLKWNSILFDLSEMWLVQFYSTSVKCDWPAPWRQRFCHFLPDKAWLIIRNWYFVGIWSNNFYLSRTIWKFSMRNIYKNYTSFDMSFSYSLIVKTHVCTSVSF